MSIREAIEKKPAVFLSVAVLAVLLVLWYSHGSFGSGSSAQLSSNYFTTDDGVTFFSAGADRLPPFDHNGAMAYRVFVYSCDGGKSKFAGYLQRFTPIAQSRIESQQADYKAGRRPTPPLMTPGDSEIKAPGKANPWINQSSPEAMPIMNIHCPDGTPANMVVP